jgi:hypothetical protein
MRRALQFCLVAVVVAIVAWSGSARASNNACWTYNAGHVYYVGYQNNPAGPEYIVDLGDESIFLNATDTIMPITMNLSAGDFNTVFPLPANRKNIWVGFFGDQNPPARTALMSANGPKDDFQLLGSSIIGANSQLESWATGIKGNSNQIGSPICSANAATFSGSTLGSYQFTLNSIAQGSLSGNVAWNVETRLSDNNGVFTQTNKIHFDLGSTDPVTHTASRGYLGYFIVFTDGTAQYWPDRDGDFLPDVPIGSDPNADKCTQVSSTDQTDADGDNHSVPCDCQDNNPAVWGQIPTEVPSVTIATDKQTISWTTPAVFFGSSPAYDVFRATQSVGGAVPVYTCFAPNNPGASTVDGSTPPAGAAFFYLVRAQTGCGNGTLGVPNAFRDAIVPNCP